jgi:hypothetical protein
MVRMFVWNEQRSPKAPGHACAAMSANAGRREAGHAISLDG